MRSSFVRSLFLPALIIGTVALTPLTSATAGTVVLSNLANSNSGSDTVNYNTWVGDAFLTDSQSWRLNTVTLDMVAGTSSTGSGFYFAAIYSDTNSEPGTALETLTGSTNPYTAGQYTYSAAGSGLLLAPNTRYWVVQGLSTSSSSESGAYKTRYTSSSAETGDWSIPATDYQAYLTPGSSWDVLDFDYRKLEITATVNSNAVPELDPGSAGGVVALVTGALGWLERRRRRSA